MSGFPHDQLDRGLAYDLSTLLSRRQVVKLLAGAGLVVMTGCGLDAPEGSALPTPAGTAAGRVGAGSTTGADCSEIPGETSGPFPGDGSNGPNVLTESGIVRRDIRSSFGSASGTADGVPLTINLTILDMAKGCTAMAGAAVYVWQCDREGRYSLYSPGATDQIYLRGVQEADGDGRVTFQSIFPAAYSGRWPHVHFEVYRSLAAATSASDEKTISQLALPGDVCQLVYATGGYAQSMRNLAQTSLDRDLVFGDGWDKQLATVEGNASRGFTAELEVPV
jgi:protocatechuate 3,4-dioxygenase beta subunit